MNEYNYVFSYEIIRNNRPAGAGGFSLMRTNTPAALKGFHEYMRKHRADEQYRLLSVKTVDKEGDTVISWTVDELGVAAHPDHLPPKSAKVAADQLDMPVLYQQGG